MPDESPVVYIVDDDASMRQAIARLVRSAGIRSMVFESAEQFLACSRPPGPACLVLDVRMPGISGMELQQRLNSTDSDLPIVFVTGHWDNDVRGRAMDAGALAFLAKPFEDRALLKAIRKAFRDGKNIGK